VTVQRSRGSWCVSSRIVGLPARRHLGQFHGLKEVKKAAKKAKAFETRKIVKWLRASGASPREKRADKSVLDAELKALKTIDHERIGTLALKSKLKKDKLLSSHPSIQSALSNIFASDVAPAVGVIASKLESRLLSSKTLSKEVNTVILSLYSALKSSRDEGEGDDDESSRFHEPQILDPPAAANQRVAIEASEDNSSDSDDNSSGSTDSTRGSGSSQHDDASQTLGTESAFLPTLSNGFIPGGSDTDWSDGEARVADGVRKNRRGQRARRAIWEKKYGKGAKHLQKREGSGPTHDARTIRKHFKGPQTTPRSRFPDSSKRNSRAEKTDNVWAIHQRKSRAVDDRPLHPSWVAKMRTKEKSSAVIVPSQGKRIKFDD
jgi:hypothetical protein